MKSRLFFLVIVYLLLVHASSDYYKILELSRDDVTIEKIKKAYRRLALKYHPDKNKEDPDAEQKFLSVNKAYEVLSNPETKELYDKYGEEGLNMAGDGGGKFHNAFDIFSQFFGGGGSGGGRGRAKAADKNTKLTIQLKDIFLGTTIPVSLNKQSLCKACRGSGAKDSNDVKTCTDCNGNGVRVVRHQIAPGFFQQVQMQCDKCGGKGKIVKTVCPTCSGVKVTRENAMLAVEIEKGIPDNHVLKFEGEGDEHPEADTGDILILLEIAPHPLFIRQGNNLYMSQTLTLKEALFGFEKTLKHLDDSSFKLSRSTVTQPGFVQVIPNLGMPKWNIAGKGNLYVEYQVILPTTLSSELKAALKGHLDL